MLWYKNWLETRWRLAFSAMMYLLQFYGVYKSAPRGLYSAADLGAVCGRFAYVWLISAVFAAGTGIKTQSARMSIMRGLHGSTYFTLTLPSSRFKLFAMRTAFGLVQMSFVIVTATCGIWALFPSTHDSVTLLSALSCGLMFAACSLVFYFVSALLAVYLDPQWQVYGAIALVGLFWWQLGNAHSSLNLFAALRDAAPLINHSFPWAAMATSVGLALVLFLVTLRIIQTREF